MHKHKNLPIIVLGAGLAGLAAAYTLTKHNKDVIVLEARERVGGRVWTKHIQADKDYHIELGGEWIGKKHTNILGLIKEMKLSLLIHKLDPAFILQNKYIPAKEWKYSEEWQQKFTQILQELRTASKRTINMLDNVDVLTFLEEYNLPSQDLEMFSLLQRSMYGEYATRISAYDALIDNYIKEDFIEDMEDYYIKGGNSLLPEALAACIGNDKVICNTKIISIKQRADYVQIDCANGTCYRARRVICTLPAFAMRSIDWFPHLPAEKERVLQTLHYSRVTKTAFLFHERFWENNFHVLTEDVMCEIYHATQNQKGKQGVLTSYAAGDLAYAVSRMSEKERIDNLKHALQPVFGKIKGIEEQHMYAWGDDPYTHGAYSIDQPSHAIKRRHILAAPFNRVEFAGEHLGTMQGYMEGAVETGIQAAHKLMVRR